jgi:hypothetical protein
MHGISTLDRVQRNWGSIYSLPEGLWRYFEKVTPENLRELMACLELAVSNGWMGVAAEISEFIQLSEGDLLDNEPALRIRVEIERLKRFSYLGFEQATKSAGQRVLGFIEKYKNDLDAQDQLVWESVVVTSCAWFVTDPAELELLIEHCRKIDEMFVGVSTYKDLCASFMYALEGRHAALISNARRCERKFSKATELCSSHGLQTPLAHITMRHAESLVILHRWREATNLARNFLLSSNDSPKRLFRSHLLLRAILILLEAPEDFVAPDEFKYNAFRYQILVYATGLAPSQTLYPLLERARTIVSRKSATFDIYHLDWREELVRQIKQLEDVDYERLIKFLYESLNYEVKYVPADFPAFDLIAISADSKLIVGLQVKHNTSELHSKHIPDDVAYDKAKELLEKVYNISRLDAICWYTINKLDVEAYARLKLRVKNSFGPNCQLETVELDELVNLLLDKPELLKRVVFSNQWKTPSQEAGAENESDESRSNTNGKP